MRRPIGWVDKECADGRREVRVSFHADSLRWQFLPRGEKKWRDDLTPSPENWRELEEKLLGLKQRGHLFDREIALVRSQCAGVGENGGRQEA